MLLHQGEIVCGGVKEGRERVLKEGKEAKPRVQRLNLFNLHDLTKHAHTNLTVTDLYLLVKVEFLLFHLRHSHLMRAHRWVDRYLLPILYWGYDKP